jgi:hypothetical protein
MVKRGKLNYTEDMKGEVILVKTNLLQQTKCYNL